MLSVDHSHIDGPPLAVKCVRKFGSDLGGEVTRVCSVCACVCVCVCVCVNAHTCACKVPFNVCRVMEMSITKYSRVTHLRYFIYICA